MQAVERDRTASYIRTFAGTKFFVFEPKMECIHPKDIGHALAHLCRFCGHCKRFYSVAEHTMLVMKLAALNGEPWVVLRACLLHDIPEAYISDLATPLKRHIDLYKEVEENLLEVVHSRFDIERFDGKVKKYDLIALWIEGNYLIGHDPEDWTPYAPQNNEAWIPIDGPIARFLCRWPALGSLVGMVKARMASRKIVKLLNA